MKSLNEAQQLSKRTEQQQSESFYDEEEKAEKLRREITLNRSQLLELTYDDATERFIRKLEELNLQGHQSIVNENFQEAIVYLSEAENILEYAASCGKTIERNLIISTLQNQACVYHRIWELEKSINYIEAIIFNITSFLEGELNSGGGIELREETLKLGSEQYIKASIYLRNKMQLIFFYLQFCAVSSQNLNHENALSAASKALNVMKEICEEEYKLQRIGRKTDNIQENHHEQMLLELCNIREFNLREKQDSQNYAEELEKLYQKISIKAKKTLAVFEKKVLQRQEQRQIVSQELMRNKIEKSKTQNQFQRLKYSKSSSTNIFQNSYQYTLLNPEQEKQLQHYSIGLVMQIHPTTVQMCSRSLKVQEELKYLKKVYKAIYISIAHFTMATELRLIHSEKQSVNSNEAHENSVKHSGSEGQSLRDQNEQKNEDNQLSNLKSTKHTKKTFSVFTIEHKKSQIHHLIAIITVASFVPCETVYLEHILNSYKNHYQIDLTENSQTVSEVNTEEIWKEQNEDESGDLIHLQTSSLNLKKETKEQLDHHSDSSNPENIHNPQSIQQQFRDSSVSACHVMMKDSYHAVSSTQEIYHPRLTQGSLRQSGSPDIYPTMKKGMVKKKTGLGGTNKESQKSLKNSSTRTPHLHTPLIFTSENLKSPSMGKEKNKRSNNKNIGNKKSRKKSTKKTEQSAKSPSLYREDMKKKEQLKPNSRKDNKSSSKSRKKSSKNSKLGSQSHSKEKIIHSKNYYNSTGSRKNLLSTNHIHSKKRLSYHPEFDSLERSKQKSKDRSGSKKKGGKKESSTKLKRETRAKRKTDEYLLINQRSSNANKQQIGKGRGCSGTTINAESITFKFINMKKGKSPIIKEMANSNRQSGITSHLVKGSSQF